MNTDEYIKTRAQKHYKNYQRKIRRQRELRRKYVLAATSFILILVFATSTFDFPTVANVAIICLFKLLTETVSLSTNIKLPIPALAKAIAIFDPRPPKPQTAMVAEENRL